MLIELIMQDGHDSKPNTLSRDLFPKMMNIPIAKNSMLDKSTPTPSIKPSLYMLSFMITQPNANQDINRAKKNILDGFILSVRYNAQTI